MYLPQCHLFFISFKSTFLAGLGAEWCYLLIGVECVLWASLLACSGTPKPWRSRHWACVSPYPSVPASPGFHFSWAFTGVIGRREPSSQTIVCTEIILLFSSKWNNVLPAPNESSCLFPPFFRKPCLTETPSLFINALSKVFVQK